MAEGLEAIAGDRAKNWIKKFTTNRYARVATGAAGVALVLGAEVGTCADTLIATIGRERPALRTGIFHLLFNLTTARICVLLAAQLAKLAQWVSVIGGAQGNVAREIANAQLVFNVLGVLLVIGFLPLIARLLEKLIPDGKQQQAETKTGKHEVT